MAFSGVASMMSFVSLRASILSSVLSYALKRFEILRHLYIKTCILPRYARDKHRENSNKAVCSLFLSALPTNVCPEPVLVKRYHFAIESGETKGQYFPSYRRCHRVVQSEIRQNSCGRCRNLHIPGKEHHRNLSYESGDIRRSEPRGDSTR